MAFNLFKKKYHKLDRDNLANAISIFSKGIKVSPDVDSVDVHDVIMLNEVLKLKIYFSKSTICGKTYFSMYITTFVEDIKMAEYKFNLHSPCSSAYDFHTKWSWRSVEIIHYMPNQFIDRMNDWSKQIVSEYKEKYNEALRKEEEFAKINYDKEESLLNKYR